MSHSEEKPKQEEVKEVPVVEVKLVKPVERVPREVVSLMVEGKRKVIITY